MSTSKIATLTAGAEISRYDLRHAAVAAKSDKLDGRNFASLQAQRAFFARKVAEDKAKLADTLRTLRVLYTESLRTAATTEERETITAQIGALDQEIAAL